MYIIFVQYSGPSKDAMAYVEWLKEDDRFSDILVQVSPAANGHEFPKLKLRYKPSLVQAIRVILFHLVICYFRPVHFILKQTCYREPLLFLQLEGGVSHLPLLDPSMRATRLSPSEWRKRIETVNSTDDPSNVNANAECILLDVRNGMHS